MSPGRHTQDRPRRLSGGRFGNAASGGYPSIGGAAISLFLSGRKDFVL